MGTIRILCFGDSLTAGYARRGSVYHPYAVALQSRLEAAFPKTKFVVDADGQSGETACSPHFLGRLKDAWNVPQPSGLGRLRRIVSRDKRVHWDWVIVLGGTNDLGYGLATDDIVRALGQCWTEAQSHGANVLALTVPECHAKSAKLDAERDELNARILRHTAPGFHAFDLKPAIPYHSLAKDERKKYWDDGLHLTPEGYDWMGGHVADALIKIMGEGAS